jgi:hypothetical protein
MRQLLDALKRSATREPLVPGDGPTGKVVDGRKVREDASSTLAPIEGTASPLVRIQPEAFHGLVFFRLEVLTQPLDGVAHGMRVKSVNQLAREALELLELLGCWTPSLSSRLRPFG